MEKKKMVFISQPMNGKSRDGIEAERKGVLDALPSLLGVDGVLAIPMLAEVMVATSSPAHCLGSSIIDLANADIAVFTPGWRDARGCALEHAVCSLSRIPFVELGNTGDGYFITRTETFGLWKEMEHA